MKKNGKAKQEQTPRGRVPKQPKSVVELTDHQLERVQGGMSQSGGEYVIGSNTGGAGSGKVGQV